MDKGFSSSRKWMGKIFSLIPRAMWEILEMLLQGSNDIHHTYWWCSRSSTRLLVQNGVVLCQPDPEEIECVKGKRMGHRCGAYHRTSDAKVRMARIGIAIAEYQLLWIRICVPVSLVSWICIYIGAYLFLLAVGAALMVISFPYQ